MQLASAWQDQSIACPIIRNSLLQQRQLLDESVNALKISQALLAQAFQQLDSMVLGPPNDNEYLFP